MDIPVYEKRGYLNEDFRLFFITGRGLPELDYHYHEFHKILFLKDGKAGYSVEGRHYDLEKNDIVTVPSGSVHRPEVEPGSLYSRAVLYISPEFLKRQSTADTRLESCFPAMGEGHVARLRGAELAGVQSIFDGLEQAERSEDFGRDVICRGLILQLAVLLARWRMKPDNEIVGTANDGKILEILEFINENISADLGIDALAERFYISKFHMMRRFRAETGYTIHGYVTNKRLLAARRMIAEGEPATSACYKCGFRDYSTFSRAYKKTFDDSPAGRGRGEGKQEK